jgi:diguanylate cyclase (GGDEF)-like protein
MPKEGTTSRAGGPPSATRWLWLAVAVGVGVLFLHTVLGLGSSESEIENWVYSFVAFGSAAIVLARAATRTDGRRGWTLIGAGLLLWGLAGFYESASLAFENGPGFPSVVDAGYLLGYPVLLFGIAILVELRIPRMTLGGWLDVLIGGLVIATLGYALLMDFVLEETTGSGFEVGVAVTYPILDLVALAVAAAALALTGWRPGRTLALVAVGTAAAAVGDAVGTYRSLAGDDTEGWIVLWSLGIALIALGALQRQSSLVQVSGRAEGWRALASPSVFGVGVLAFQLIVSPTEGETVRVLTIATVAAVVGRIVFTFTENRRLVSLLERDGLTRLGNRSKLAVDIHRLLREPDTEPHVLTILDLDGFKAYNDTFGHPAGDSLLLRLGSRLGAAVKGRGHAYRLGGDEFAVLTRGTPEEAGTLIEDASEALTEQGEGFRIGSSYGSVELPAEANTATNALQLADQRMYKHKDSRRQTPAGEVQAVVVRILQHRSSVLGDRGDAVAMVAKEIGRAIDLSRDELGALARAAELHDVGKMAIPDELLVKTGSLDEDEWEFIRQHTILGERILSAAPSLAPLAAIVRSTHERWDGKGYPDGLEGEEIPLAARIISVCDAYEAMIRARPYAESKTPDEALDELRRCAGTQFDPRIVETLESILTRVRTERRERRRNRRRDAAPELEPEPQA